MYALYGLSVCQTHYEGNYLIKYNLNQLTTLNV
jgi:hypothetical protein